MGDDDGGGGARGVLRWRDERGGVAVFADVGDGERNHVVRGVVILVAGVFALLGGALFEEEHRHLFVLLGAFVNGAHECDAVFQILFGEDAGDDGVLGHDALKPVGVDVFDEAGFLQGEALGLDLEGEFLDNDADALGDGLDGFLIGIVEFSEAFRFDFFDDCGFHWLKYTGP